MFKNLILTTGVVSALTLAGCATMTNPSTDRNLTMLQNKNWLVTEINGVEYKVNPAQTVNIASLMFNNSALSGSDGCNRIMGVIQLKALKLLLRNWQKHKWHV